MMMNIGIQVANQIIIIIIIIMNIKTKNEKRKLNSSQESLHSITVYSFENELIRTEYNKSNVTTPEIYDSYDYHHLVIFTNFQTLPVHFVCLSMTTIIIGILFNFP